MTVPVIEGNRTGAAIAEETSIKVLPVTPNWEPLEPNSYPTAPGAETTTVARRPINANRMELPGTVTGVASQVAINQDLTQHAIQRRMREFLLANLRTKAELTVATVTSSQYSPVSGGGAYAENDLLWAKFASLDNNNGLKTVAAGGGAAAVPVAETLTADTGEAITISKVGRHFALETFEISAVDDADDDATITAHPFVTGWGPVRLTTTDTLPAGLSLATDYWIIVDDANTIRFATSKANALADTDVDLTDTGTGTHTVSSPGVTVDVSGEWPRLWFLTYDPTGLSLVSGEPIISGDATNAAYSWASAANNGFKRARQIVTGAGGSIYIDKSDAAMVDATDGTKTIRLFIARSIKNEADRADYVRPTSTIEVILGAPDELNPTDEQAEYIEGCVGDTFSVSIPIEDKVVVDMTYMGLDTRYATAGNLDDGDRPAVLDEDPFNTTTDTHTQALTYIEDDNESPDDLFDHLGATTITIANKLKVLKKPGSTGFEVLVGGLEVSAQTVGYFQVVGSLSAIRNNTDLTMHERLVKQGQGIVIDLPLVRGSGAAVELALDTEATQPVALKAFKATSVYEEYDHAIMWSFFDYVPAGTP